MCENIYIHHSTIFISIRYLNQNNMNIIRGQKLQCTIKTANNMYLGDILITESSAIFYLYPCA